MVNEGWGFICVVGFWGWVLATVGFIFKGFPSGGVFNARPAALWGGIIALFFIIWIVGMTHA
jgi:hypothetical protein